MERIIKSNDDTNQFDRPYLTLLKAEGLIGILLPVVLPLGVFLLRVLGVRSAEVAVLQGSFSV